MNIISVIIVGVFILGLVGLFLLRSAKVGFNLRIVFAAAGALIFGILLQSLLGPEHEALVQSAPVFNFVANIYTRILRLLVVPVLLFGIIVVVFRISTSQSSKSLFKTTGFATGILLINTFIGALIGVGTALWFNVGGSLDIAALSETAPKYEYKGLIDSLLGYLPSNIFAALSSSNALQVVIIAVLVGFATVIVHKHNEALVQPFVTFAEAAFEIVKGLATIVIRFTPYGVFALLSRSFAVYGWDLLFSLWSFILANVAGFVILFAVQLATVGIFGRVSIFSYTARVFEALSVAFTTRSSFGTIPVTIATLQEKFSLHPETARAIPSIGASVGMNACAGLWPAIVGTATLQALGLPVTLTTAVLIAGASIIASIGVSGLPGTATVAASASFALLGIPFTLVPLLQGVDFFIDMARTALNVNGTITAAVSADEIVYKRSKNPHLSQDPAVS